MKSDLAEKLRSNLITQALIVVLCLTFSSNRRSQTADFDDLETLYVTQLLMSATVGEVRNNDDPAPPPAGETSLAADIVAYGNAAPTAGEIDSLALMISKSSSTYKLPVHRMALPSGGWVRFYADAATFKKLATPPVESGVPLYELTMVVTPDSDLHQQNEIRITFTNAEKSVNPITHASFWETMKIRAFVEDQSEPMSEDDIQGLIRIKARDWSGATGTLDTLYSSARYSYENEEITIPVVNIQVSASMALAAIAIVATALCAFMSYQCRQAAVSNPEPTETHQGVFILKPKDGTVPPGFWHHLLAHAEIWFVQPPYWIGMLSPIICALLLAVAHADIDYSWLGWVLLPFALGYVWLLARAIVGVSWTKKDPAPEPA